MLRRSLFILSFLISACGKEYLIDGNTADTSKKSTDEQFIPYILYLNSAFSQAMGHDYQVKTPVKMVEKFDDSETIARCIYYGSSYDSRNYIEVSQEMLNEIDPYIKDDWMTIVLAHEIGHCDFSLQHNYEGLIKKDVGEQKFKGSDGKSGYRRLVLRKSLMWPSLSPSETGLLKSLLNEYIKEIVDSSYYLSNTIETFNWDPDRLPPMGYLYRYSVVSSSGETLLKTFSSTEFRSYLGNDMSLFNGSEPPSESSQFKCGNL